MDNSKIMLQSRVDKCKETQLSIRLIDDMKL
jgi:hypothetical protein